MQGLVKYDAAVRALAECKAIDEIKDWHDKAAAMQAYGRMAKDKTLETDAAEIRIRAERRYGQLLALQKQGGGLAKPGPKSGENNSVVTHDRIPTLKEVGVSKDLSARAQKLAAVPEAQFEQEVGEWRDRVNAEGARVTARLESAGEAALKKKPTKPVEKPEVVTPADDSAPTELEVLREQAADYATLRADNEQLHRIVDADDIAKAALAEVTRFKEQVRVLTERNNGLMNEKNLALQQAKMWMTKFRKAEKELNAATAGVAF